MANQVYGHPFKITFVPWRMLTAARLLGAACLLLSVNGICYADDRLLPTIDEIRHEATLPAQNPLGHPLPLLADWNTNGSMGGFHPVRQLALIEQGHYLLPWFFLPAPDQRFNLVYYKQAIEKAAQLKLPISFISTQWEYLLTSDEKYFALPPDENPNEVTTEGEVLKKVSPFGPLEPWEDVGKRWTANPTVRKLQEWYPNPPLVLFISNNEHTKLAWTEASNSKRFLDRYGKGADEETSRRAIGDGWISHYRALQKGMREGLAANAWRENSIFVGYDAWGTSAFGRWGGWTQYSLHVPGRFSPMPLAWDGASISYYLNNWEATTDFSVWSPQVEAMNWVFMLSEAMQSNPNFWLEISVWDGHELDAARDKREYFRSLGESYTPARYVGFVKFGMWLLRPRVVRDFRYLEDFDHFKPYVMALADAVDRIHTDKTLRRFWRRGRLVENPSHQHPYQEAIPKEYASVPRWFLLDTNLDKQRPWHLDTEIPVYALALELGARPEREWLVYAFAPRADQLAVGLELPDYGALKVVAGRQGRYFVVSERDKTVKKI